MKRFSNLTFTMFQAKSITSFPKLLYSRRNILFCKYFQNKIRHLQNAKFGILFLRKNIFVFRNFIASWFLKVLSFHIFWLLWKSSRSNYAFIGQKIGYSNVQNSIFIVPAFFYVTADYDFWKWISCQWKWFQFTFDFFFWRKGKCRLNVDFFWAFWSDKINFVRYTDISLFLMYNALPLVFPPP